MSFFEQTNDDDDIFVIIVQFAVFLLTVRTIRYDYVFTALYFSFRFPSDAACDNFFFILSSCFFPCV